MLGQIFGGYTIFVDNNFGGQKMFGTKMLGGQKGWDQIFSEMEWSMCAMGKQGPPLTYELSFIIII